MSTISRIPATKYYDNKQDGIDFKDDRFSIDGQRLIIKSGTYGANGSVYQTENYSNVKVVAYGNSPYGSTYGPSYFIVYYPNGTRAWYGNAGNSRSRLEWAIFRWRDPQGNYVDYNYQSDNGLLSIKTIKFGGRIGGTSPTNQIDFTYANRSRPEMVYVGEYSFRRTNLLRSIQVTGNGSQYRKYELTYNSTSLGYQRLVSIKEYNAKNKYLNPITFNYDDTDSWIKDRVQTGVLDGFNNQTSALNAGDYDGDGRTDVLFYNKKNASRIHMYSGLYNPQAKLDYIDTDGFKEAFSSTILSNDNKILNKQAVTTIKETSSNQIRFRTYAKDENSAIRHEYDKVWNAPTYIDYGEVDCNIASDANGITNINRDVLSGRTSTVSSAIIKATNTIHANAKATYTAGKTTLKPGFHAKNGAKFSALASSSFTKRVPMTYVNGDFNGDGLTDVLAIAEQYYIENCYEVQIPGSDACVCDDVPVNVGNSEVYFIDLKRNSSSTPIKIGALASRIKKMNSRFSIADHNGDGKQDLYHFQEGKLYIYTLDSNNNLVEIHKEEDSNISFDFPILFGDYNGDGKTDFITATANKSINWKFFVSQGKSFYKQTKRLPFAYYQNERIRGTVVKNGVSITDPYYEYKYTAQDVNGDGKTDLMLHNVITPYSAYDRSVEYISVYKNNQISSSLAPTFSYETGYTDTSGQVGKFGSPIFLEANISNGNLEYGYISVNNIYMYEFAKDHKKDVALQSITNNGIKTTINYERLGIPDSRYGYQTYTSDTSQSYPYMNINRANSFQLVKKLTEEGAGIKRYQDFRYHGAVSNINIGFQGFLKTKRSNWYGDGVGTLWTISKHDITKKGAVTEQWVSTSSHEGNRYISKNTNTYNINLASNKVFTNLTTKVIQHNNLSGVTTSKNYTYDSYKNILTENTVYNGGNRQITYTYSNNSSANSQYYHTGRVTKKIETSTIGGNAFTTEEQYSYSNNLLTQQKAKGNGTAWNTESFTYDAFGNVIRKRLAPSGLLARTENFKYDTSGRFLTESTDIEGLKTKTTYNSFGNPLTTTNPYNQVVKFTYDGWNRLISEKNYLGKTTTLTYSYISGGGLRKTINYSQGADEVVEYNALGWVMKSKVLGINNKWTQKSFQYDVAGRGIVESEPYFTVPDQSNTVAFDSYGREITRTSYNGLTVNITYNGLVTTVNDGTKTVRTTKDGMGNIVKMEDPGGTIHYEYYGNGVMKTANYGSHIVSTEIDGWGRKIKLTDPSAGAYTYEYNNLGEVLKETTPKGTTTYMYDVFGKIITKKITGEETNMNLNYTYNSATKLLTSIKGKNERTNENYSYTYLYDTKKRPHITKEQNGKAYFEHQVIRDSYGRVSEEVYITTNHSDNVNSTVKVKNVFDTNSGILTEIKDLNTNASLWKINEVNQRGQALKATLGNGISKNRTYDQYGFLTKIYDSASSVVLDVDYSFNSVRGNLNSRKNNSLGWNESFIYDDLDRLTNISGSVSRSQEYDDRGRITSNSEIGSYNYESNNVYRLKGVDLNTNGNLHYQNQPIQKIKYNAYKKPVSIAIKDKAKVDFEYGILQNRSHAYFGGNEENKLDRRYQKHYSGITPVEIEVDKQGNTKIITYIGGDAYSAPVVHIKQTKTGEANGYHYLHRDYLGSILAITNSAATVLEQRQFGAWGGVDKFKKGSLEIDFENSTTLLNRGYTGHEHFMSVALIHMNGRMYDAKLGRFLSPDNYIQEPFSTQSFNRYGYVLNNPLKYTDQSGEFFFTAILVGALIGATAGAVAYIVSAAITGNWSWSGFGQAILGGAISGAIGGAIGPTALFKSILTNGFWGTAAIAAASSFLPSVDVKIGDWSFGLSPALAFGRATGFGVNVSASYNDGNFTFSAGYGVTLYGSAHGNGNKGWEYRKSWGVNWDDGKQGFGVYKTTFSGVNPQKVGGLSYRNGGFGFRYENDGAPFPERMTGGTDRNRTAALSLSYKDYSIGFNLFTGDYVNKEDTESVAGHPNSSERRKYLFGLLGEKGVKGGQYKGGTSNDPNQRMGALYFGYKGYRLGGNSEGIRHVIQNIGAHTGISYQPWFKKLDIAPTGYFQYQSANPYTLW